MLSRNAVTEFQEIYQEELGTEISYEEAAERAEKFLRLFKTVCQSIPEDWLKKHAKERSV